MFGGGGGGGRSLLLAPPTHGDFRVLIPPSEKFGNGGYPHIHNLANISINKKNMCKAFPPCTISRKRQPSTLPYKIRILLLGYQMMLNFGQ
jgi:hypothetical protein